MPTPDFVLENVNRITVVGPDGVLFEQYAIYPAGGVECFLQDDGRTLKIFPRDVK